MLRICCSDQIVKHQFADLIRATRSEFSQHRGWSVSIENGFQIFTPLVVSIKLIKARPKGRKTQTLLRLLLHLEPPPWIGRKRRPSSKSLINTINPLLSPPGGLFFSSTFEGGLNREGGFFNLA